MGGATAARQRTEFVRLCILHCALCIFAKLTLRLYYTDAYLATFSGTVAEVFGRDGRTAVVLDRTAFYPTSGGQPFDTGMLGGIRVDDVIELDDGRVAHVVARRSHAGWR